MAVWFGLENGLPTADMSPHELAPTSQLHFQWPKWGQYHETQGKAGEPIDLDWAQELFDLSIAWRESSEKEERSKIWDRMLTIRAEQTPTIGLISGVPQPVVVNRHLRNVPVKGVYNWEPGAHFGIYRPDTFWFAEK